MSGRSRRLRTLLAARRVVAAPGVYDAFTARIVERCGFAAAYLGGNALGLSLGKGQPFVTLTETAEATARIVRATELPLVVDAGAGFGDPAHVRLAVREIEAAGAAALHIDDQPYPKEPRYHLGRGRLAPTEAVVAKLRAAVAGRRDPDLMIIARTDALRVTGSLDETIARARLYAEADIDAIIALDLGPAQAPALAAAVPGTPLVWIGGVTPPIPRLEALGAAGFAMALYPFNTVAAVNAAVGDVWQGLAEAGAPAQTDAVLERARRETLDLARMQEAFEAERAAGSAD